MTTINQKYVIIAEGRRGNVAPGNFLDLLHVFNLTSNEWLNSSNIPRLKQKRRSSTSHFGMIFKYKSIPNSLQRTHPSLIYVRFSVFQSNLQNSITFCSFKKMKSSESYAFINISSCIILLIFISYYFKMVSIQNNTYQIFWLFFYVYKWVLG